METSKTEYLKNVNDIMNKYAYCWMSFTIISKNLHIRWTSVLGDTYEAKDLKELETQLQNL